MAFESSINTCLQQIQIKTKKDFLEKAKFNSDKFIYKNGCLNLIINNNGAMSFENNYPLFQGIK